MGEITPFGPRKKKEPGEEDNAIKSQKTQESVGTPPLFDKNGLSLRARIAKGKLEDALAAIKKEIPPEEVNQYEVARLKVLGVDLKKYTDLIKTLHSLVEQVPPGRKKNEMVTYMSVVNKYSPEQVVGFLNNASISDLETKPIFYHVLVLRIEQIRENYRDLFYGEKLRQKSKKPKQPTEE